MHPKPFYFPFVALVKLPPIHLTLLTDVKSVFVRFQSVRAVYYSFTCLLFASVILQSNYYLPLYVVLFGLAVKRYSIPHGSLQHFYRQIHRVRAFSLVLTIRFQVTANHLFAIVHLQTYRKAIPMLNIQQVFFKSLAYGLIILCNSLFVNRQIAQTLNRFLWYLSTWTNQALFSFFKLFSCFVLSSFDNNSILYISPFVNSFFENKYAELDKRLYFEEKLTKKFL